jgi:prepilin-type N-terminal cleavage/methylation domain-containing protein
MKSISASRHNGFSLLEMVVAISILALSLAALYQAVSGATRNVRTDERYIPLYPGPVSASRGRLPVVSHGRFPRRHCRRGDLQ